MSGIYIIAEAGVNHNGDLDLAVEMVRAAARAGADAVKFQTFTAAALATADAPKAAYQERAAGRPESQHAMLQRLELDEAAHRVLIGECRRRDIEFLSTAFDLASVDMLHRLGMARFKVPSGEIDHVPYLRRIGGLGKPIILSTGMATLAEVEAALTVLQGAGARRDEITVLHCHTQYPTDFRDVNLKAMVTMREELGVQTGYSDHTLGIEVPVAAAALGAVIIEKHFTIDRSMEGPDHAASLEAEEFANMVVAVRHTEVSLGSGIKSPTPSELEIRPVARKSLVASRDIREGEVFSEHNLAAKRPGTGLSPLRWDEIVGRRSKRAYRADEPIEL